MFRPKLLQPTVFGFHRLCNRVSCASGTTSGAAGVAYRGLNPLHEATLKKQQSTKRRKMSYGAALVPGIHKNNMMTCYACVLINIIYIFHDS